MPNILNSLTIEAGGILTSTGATRQSATTITINGTYINGSTRDFVVTTMNINSGGVYQHDINGGTIPTATYRDWETDRKSTRLNSSHITRSRMPSSA